MLYEARNVKGTRSTEREVRKTDGLISQAEVESAD